MFVRVALAAAWRAASERRRDVCCVQADVATGHVDRHAARGVLPALAARRPHRATALDLLAPTRRQALRQH